MIGTDYNPSKQTQNNVDLGQSESMRRVGNWTVSFRCISTPACFVTPNNKVVVTRYKLANCDATDEKKQNDSCEI